MAEDININLKLDNLDNSIASLEAKFKGIAKSIKDAVTSIGEIKIEAISNSHDVVLSINQLNADIGKHFNRLISNIDKGLSPLATAGVAAAVGAVGTRAVLPGVKEVTIDKPNIDITPITPTAAKPLTRPKPITKDEVDVSWVGDIVKEVGDKVRSAGKVLTDAIDTDLGLAFGHIASSFDKLNQKINKKIEETTKGSLLSNPDFKEFFKKQRGSNDFYGEIAKMANEELIHLYHDFEVSQLNMWDKIKYHSFMSIADINEHLKDKIGESRQFFEKAAEWAVIEAKIIFPQVSKNINEFKFLFKQIWQEANLAFNKIKKTVASTVRYMVNRFAWATKRISQAFVSVGKSIFTGLVSIVSKLAIGLGLAIAGGIAGFTAMAVMAARTASQIKTISDMLGLTTDEYQSLRQAMLASGVSDKAISSGLEDFTEKVGEARSGTGELFRYFDQLGLDDSFFDLSNQDKLYAFADGLKNIKDTSLRSVIAYKVMGKSSGQLVLALSQGSEALKQQQKNMKDMGLVLSYGPIAAMEKLTSKFTLLKEISRAFFGGFSGQIAASINPVFDALQGRLKDMGVNFESMGKYIADILINISTIALSYLPIVMDVAQKALAGLVDAFTGIGVLWVDFQKNLTNAMILGYNFVMEFDNIIKLLVEVFKSGLAAMATAFSHFWNQLKNDMGVLGKAIRALPKIAHNASLRHLLSPAGTGLFLASILTGEDKIPSQNLDELIQRQNQVDMANMALKKDVNTLLKTLTNGFVEFDNAAAASIESSIKGISDGIKEFDTKSMKEMIETIIKNMRKGQMAVPALQPPHGVEGKEDRDDDKTMRQLQLPQGTLYQSINYDRMLSEQFKNIKIKNVEEEQLEQQKQQTDILEEQLRIWKSPIKVQMEVANI